MNINISSLDGETTFEIWSYLSETFLPDINMTAVSRYMTPPPLIPSYLIHPHTHTNLTLVKLHTLLALTHLLIMKLNFVPIWTLPYVIHLHNRNVLMEACSVSLKTPQDSDDQHFQPWVVQCVKAKQPLCHSCQFPSEMSLISVKYLPVYSITVAS